jgi:hypothetical protein
MPKDLMYGFRMLAKSPGFTIVALLSLALGIGANTAIFSVVHRVLLHPVAYPDPDRLLVVWNTNPSLGIRQSVASVPDFEDWKAQNHVFEQMAALQSGSVNITGVQTPERVQVLKQHRMFSRCSACRPNWDVGSFRKISGRAGVWWCWIMRSGSEVLVVIKMFCLKQ